MLGWYKLCFSSDVKPGEVIKVSALSHDFAIFRGCDGKIAVLDAYCPHLGADLSKYEDEPRRNTLSSLSLSLTVFFVWVLLCTIAVGGKVKGNCLECPFHKWQYDTDGKVTHIPYLEKIPSVAKTHSWPVTEYHGHVVIYWDDERRDPP